MQALLTDSYLRAAAAVEANTALQAFIAPAGLAWQKVYHDMGTNVTGVTAGLYMCVSYMNTFACPQFLKEIDLLRVLDRSIQDSYSDSAACRVGKIFSPLQPQGSSAPQCIGNILSSMHNSKLNNRSFLPLSCTGRLQAVTAVYHLAPLKSFQLALIARSLAGFVISSSVWTGCELGAAGNGYLGMNVYWSNYLEQVSNSVMFQQDLGVALPPYPWQVQTEGSAICSPNGTTILNWVSI